MTYNKTSLTKRQLALKDTKHPRHQQPKLQAVDHKARISRRARLPNASSIVESESEAADSEPEVSRYFITM
jgi:hypothetical protein